MDATAAGKAHLPTKAAPSIANTNLFVGANTGSSGHFIQQSSTNPNDPLPSTSVVNALFIGYAAGSTGLAEMKSGTINTAYLEVGYAAPGTYTQSGGTVTVGTSLDIAATGQGTVNLTGGTLKLSSLTMAGSTTFNFGGGDLQAAAAFTSSVPLTLTGINGDATIDTQGFNVNLSGAVSGSGGLKKLGTGALTLTNSASYLGATTISAGKLQLNASSNLHAINGVGELGGGQWHKPSITHGRQHHYQFTYN